jgi:hypothetical protein
LQFGGTYVTVATTYSPIPYSKDPVVACHSFYFPLGTYKTTSLFFI